MKNLACCWKSVVFLLTHAVAGEGTGNVFVLLPAQQVEQTGKLPEAVADVKVLANEPDGGNCGLILAFDLETVAQRETPLARLHLGALEKLKVKRPGQKPGGSRGAVHVLAESRLAGST